MAEPLKHLAVSGFTSKQSFKSTLMVRRPEPPTRNRKTHGGTLLAQLRVLVKQEAELKEKRAQHGLPEAVGTTVALTVKPAGAIDYATQLEWKRDGIEVLSVKPDGPDCEIVVVYVPDGRLSAFETRIRAYLTETTKAKKPGAKDKPKYAALVNAIEQFKRAAFDEFWTDEQNAAPADDAECWFQLWLRVAGSNAAAVYTSFKDRADTFGIQVEPGHVPFPGRIVIAVRATRQKLQDALELLDLVAEIRGVPALAPFFLELQPFEQVDWAMNLQARSVYPQAGDGVPFITLLDTGVNRAHPLLQAAVAETDLHTVDAHWGITDHEGHGSEMAGLALHGDLSPALASDEAHIVQGRLESVKIVPPDGANPPHLYGRVTNEAATLVENASPDRKRTYTLTLTSVGPTYGLPSEWSATIDRISFGSSENGEAPRPARLFVLAAGNIPWEKWEKNQINNEVWSIENPGQAWNALTVGASTSLVDIDAEQWPGKTPLAGKGLLAPCSTTSVQWTVGAWPFKPDVVAEGGNGSEDDAGVIVGPSELRLVTTSHEVTKHLFAEAGDTSAASAEVGRLCTHIQAQYPEYWPETIRALVVHGARYSPQMIAQLPLVRRKKDKERFLRRFGYGGISTENSLNSAYQKPTLVLQEQLEPYIREGGVAKLGALNLHKLPWPSEALRLVPDADVALRVTLSYFIEPNPSRRGWRSKFRYQSHGLRFAVKGSTEDDERFMQRINKLEREALEQTLEEGEELESISDPDVRQWFLGAQLRSRGSIHSDIWMGPAAHLAEKSHVAVFPVGGWWKDWVGAQHPATVRYSLVLTLELLNNLEIDLYTPISIQLKVPIAVPVA